MYRASVLFIQYSLHKRVHAFVLTLIKNKVDCMATVETNGDKYMLIIVIIFVVSIIGYNESVGLRSASLLIAAFGLANPPPLHLDVQQQIQQ